VSPKHIIWSPLIIGVGLALTVTTSVAVLAHPFPSVPVTEYVVVAAGLTVIDVVVAPVFHKYVVAPDANNTVDVPAQIILSPLISIEGSGFTTTVLLAVFIQPNASVAVTV
jgi:hypothetical protein